MNQKIRALQAVRRFAKLFYVCCQLYGPAKVRLFSFTRKYGILLHIAV